jgi:hypothetical protein
VGQLLGRGAYPPGAALPPDGRVGDGEEAAAQRRRMLLALLSTLAVAGDEVLVVAFPGGTETAALVDAARTWPLAVREVGG